MFRDRDKRTARDSQWFRSVMGSHHVISRHDGYSGLARAPGTRCGAPRCTSGRGSCTTSRITTRSPSWASGARSAATWRPGPGTRGSWCANPGEGGWRPEAVTISAAAAGTMITRRTVPTPGHIWTWRPRSSRVASTCDTSRATRGKRRETCDKRHKTLTRLKTQEIQS